MAGEWGTVRLGDAAAITTGFPFKSDQYVQEGDAPRLLRGDNIVQGTLRWDGVKRWPKDRTSGVQDYWLREDDVVLAMDRPWIEAGLKFASIGRADLPALLVQRVARLRGTDRLCARFLKYVIASQAFTQYVLAIQTGTAVPHISAGQIREFEFSLPPLPEQRAIAHILGTLDDKIELNRRMNETLEAMTRALFQSWFVDFDPVHRNIQRAQGHTPPNPHLAEFDTLFPAAFEDSTLGEIPKGWRVKAIAELADVIGGSTPSTKEPSYWEGGSHHWATPKDLSSLAFPVLLNTERQVTDAGLAQISSGLLPAGTVLLSSRAPIGYLVIAEVPVAINQGFIAMKAKDDVSNLFLLLWARAAHEDILSRANGSTFLEISKSNFRPIQLVAPSDIVMEMFEMQARPLYRRIVESERESRTLATLRDALLPKLISGELRVKDAERFAEATA